MSGEYDSVSSDFNNDYQLDHISTTDSLVLSTHWLRSGIIWFSINWSFPGPRRTRYPEKDSSISS
ncbi:hypothetical protein CODIS_00050 [Candidatus Thiodiazotropha endolucinida]|uniref:Uncharacterized protein n=1 Tax=Candidatus Thiodiazotropha endolucinida TaxID=1655433 RepID=A0A7Z0VPE3_9GAMM|nr:hypothetical protein CODIS_00050 [Candidatus Thiodiazotropha endolucinida]